MPLPKSLEEVISDGDTDALLEVGRYYHTQNKNIPAVDSWLLVQHPFNNASVMLRFKFIFDEARYIAKNSEWPREGG